MNTEEETKIRHVNGATYNKQRWRVGGQVWGEARVGDWNSVYKGGRITPISAYLELSPVTETD
jgi:hypothetical protein